MRYDNDDKVVLTAFEEFWNGPPDNAGLIVKVIPDDTMRGLDLRKGTTDLVINDLPPDIVHQLIQDGSIPHCAFARSRLLLPRLQHA